MDEDVIEIQLSNIWLSDTGDQIDFTGTGLTDEAGNALAANTTLLLANHIPAAITSAVATIGDATTDVLTLTFSRPIFLPAGTLDAAGNLLVGLGLADPTGNPQFTASVAGGMAVLTPDRMTLTITTMQGALNGLTSSTVISGAGLQTNDALNFLAAPLGPLPVNTFAGGIASIRVVDQIPPTLISVNDSLPGPTGPVNTEAQAAADGLLQVGDVTMGDVYSIGFVFDQAVVGDRNGDGMVDAADFAGITAAFTGMANLVFDNTMVDVAMSVADVTGMTIFFNATLNPFAGNVDPVAAGDTLSIAGVTDLSGNAAVGNAATLNAVGMGINITGIGNIP